MNSSTTSSSLPTPPQEDVDIFCAAVGKEADIGSVRELLDKYGTAIVNIRHPIDNSTPLQYAAGWGQAEIAALLLERGAGIDMKNGNGWTALMSAALNGQKTTALLLLEQGAAVEEKESRYGWTALAIAELFEKPEVAALLKQWIEQQKQRFFAEQRAQFLKDTDFSKGLEKPLPKPRPFNFSKPKP